MCSICSNSRVKSRRNQKDLQEITKIKSFINNITEKEHAFHQKKMIGKKLRKI